MAPPLTVVQIFKAIHEEKSTNLKKAMVQEYKYNQLFLDILKGAFDDTIEFHEVDDVTWRPDVAPEGLSPSNLHMEFKKMYLYIKGHPKSRTVDKYTRDRLLGGCLESLHPDEAKLMLNMMKKNLGIRGLTKNMVTEIYPTLLKG